MNRRFRFFKWLFKSWPLYLLRWTTMIDSFNKTNSHPFKCYHVRPSLKQKWGVEIKSHLFTSIWRFPLQHVTNHTRAYWLGESTWSLKTYWLVSKKFKKLPIKYEIHELKSIVVNKGQIYRELRYWCEELEILIILERELEDKSTE